MSQSCCTTLHNVASPISKIPSPLQNSPSNNISTVLNSYNDSQNYQYQVNPNQTIHTRVELSTKHNTYHTHNTHMLISGHFQIHNTCYTHIFFYVYTSVHNFLNLKLFECFFQILWMFFMLLISFTDSQKPEARLKQIQKRI